MKFNCIYVFARCVSLCIFLAVQLSHCTEHKPIVLSGSHELYKTDQQSTNESDDLGECHCLIKEENCAIKYEQNEMADTGDISALNNNDTIIVVESESPSLEDTDEKKTVEGNNTNTKESGVYHCTINPYIVEKKKEEKVYQQIKNTEQLNVLQELLLECSLPFTLRLLSGLIVALIIIIWIHHLFLSQ